MRLSYLKRHLSKAKICKNCATLNYYKNYKCIVCKSRVFYRDKNLVLKEINSRYEFYRTLDMKDRKIDSLKEEIKSRKL